MDIPKSTDGTNVQTQTPPDSDDNEVVLDLDEVIQEIHNTPPKETPQPSDAPIPTPRQIFTDASKVILHQPFALRELSTIFYYHLQSQRNHKSGLDSVRFEQLSKALGLDEFFDEIDKTEEENRKKQNPNYRPKFRSKVPIANTPIFLTGKTGSGKTHMIKQLCKMFDLNFIAINTPTISNAGYKGVTLADIGASLLQHSDDSRVRAEHSVVFFDEFDKLFISDGEQLGTYHLSLMTEILTIIEGTTPFPVRDSHGIDSSRMLFVLGGSFNIHQKKEKTPIGFMGKKTLQDTPDNQLKLTDFGLPDELAGRIGKIIALDDISHHQMIDILLNSPTSPFVALKHKLAMSDCTVEIEPAVFESLIENGKEAIEKFGVRGLYQAFYNLPQVNEILFEAPEWTGSHYVITKDGFEGLKKDIPPSEHDEWEGLW